MLRQWRTLSRLPPVSAAVRKQRSWLVRPFSQCASADDHVVFKPKRVLVLSKITRYEYERRRHPELCESQLEGLLKQRGSDYSMLLYHHYIHKGCEKTLVQALHEHGLQTSVVSRFEYSCEAVRQADAVFTVGGDGTFLLGAAKLMSPDKPIVGINSDPTRSVGHLLLPTQHSVNIRLALDKLLQGKFDWLMRSRIRVVLRGKNVHCTPIELHSQQLSHPECRYLDLDWQFSVSDDECGNKDTDSCTSLVLPVLALNEVFIGECVSARVSYYELSVDGAAAFKQKSSGLCVCSGTGSTSWAYNINKLTRQNVTEVMHALAADTDLSVDPSDDRLVDSVLHRVNSGLVFDAEADHMCYTIRDPIVRALSQNESRPGRAMARQLSVKSRCFDASLVIDGGLSFPFNDGAVAELEVRPEFALRTVMLH